LLGVVGFSVAVDVMASSKVARGRSCGVMGGSDAVRSGGGFTVGSRRHSRGGGRLAQLLWNKRRYLRRRGEWHVHFVLIK